MFQNELKFSSEEEKHNKLNFLYLTVIKQNNIIHMSHKKIHSCRYLKFFYNNLYRKKEHNDRVNRQSH